MFYLKNLFTVMGTGNCQEARAPLGRLPQYSYNLRNPGSAVALYHQSEQPSLAVEVLTVDIPNCNALQCLFDLYPRQKEPVQQPGNY